MHEGWNAAASGKFRPEKPKQLAYCIDYKDNVAAKLMQDTTITVIFGTGSI